MQTKEENNKKIESACKKFIKIQNSGIDKFMQLDTWLDREASLFLGEIKNKKRKYFRYKKGTIIKVDFGVNIGSELCHTHFAIVVNNDDNVSKDSLIVVPLTSKPGYGKVPLSNLIKDEVVKKVNEQLKNSNISDKDMKEIRNLEKSYKKYTKLSYAFVSQITTISKSRILFSKNRFDIINKVRCSDELMDEIDKQIIKVLIGSKVDDKILKILVKN